MREINNYKIVDSKTKEVAEEILAAYILELTKEYPDISPISILSLIDENMIFPLHKLAMDLVENPILRYEYKN